MGDDGLPPSNSGSRNVGSPCQSCLGVNNSPEITIICVAICQCKNATQKQQCVDDFLARPVHVPNVGVYHDPYYENIHVQVPYDMATKQPLMSNSQKSAFHKSASGVARPLPKPYPGLWLLQRPKGSTRIPDIVLTHSPNDPPAGSNIKRVVEIKFEDGWRDGQFESYSELDPTGEPLELTPSRCGCGKKQEEPQTQPELKWYHYLEIATLLAAAAALIADDVTGVGTADDPVLIPILARLARYGIKLAH